MPKEKAESESRAAKAPSENDDELFELVSPTRAIDLIIQKNLEQMPDSYVVLFLEKIEQYSVINVRLASYLAKNRIPGVYVTTNKPVKSLIEVFKNEKIDAKNFLFADGITRMNGAEPVEGENCIYVDSPKNLIDLSIAIETQMQKIKGTNRFVLFDSLSTLLVYNKPTVVAKFMHAIASKIRAWRAKGVFLMIQEKDEEVTKIIAQFCDETKEFKPQM
ncbi:MAG: hypothetical protein PHH08_03195 [Candidatus ainarchaeum sp.]|nr:hypothetical protein [Candidatus ainarchaeum sp.]